MSDGENALNALDLLINVLKDHEKELDKLVNELRSLVQRLSVLESLAKRIEEIDRRLSSIEAPRPVERPSEAPTLPPPQQYGPPSILKFRSWEEFREMASGGEAVSYVVRREDGERVIEVSALKGRMILVYSGPLPKPRSLIKSWLAGELRVSRSNVFEGSITPPRG